MKTLRLVLLLLGLIFLTFLIARVGPDRLLAALTMLSWRLLVIVALPYGLVATVHTLGWRFAFRQDLASFRTLFSVRLAGEAFNATTPTVSVGGEPIKALLLRPRVPFGDGVVSVIADKTTTVVAQSLFLAVGLAVAWLLLPMPSGLLWAMAVLLVVEALAVGGFALVQLSGFLGRGHRFLTWLGFPYRESHADELRRLDHSLEAYYRQHPRRLGYSVFFHLAGWVLGSLEVYLVLSFLGVSVSLTTAVVIWALSTSISFMAFVIPAGLGVLEGGMMAVFMMLGLDPGIGLSQTLVRRLRELAWVVIGLLLLAALKPEAQPLET